MSFGLATVPGVPGPRSGACGSAASRATVELRHRPADGSSLLRRQARAYADCSVTTYIDVHVVGEVTWFYRCASR